MRRRNRGVQVRHVRRGVSGARLEPCVRRPPLHAEVYGLPRGPAELFLRVSCQKRKRRQEARDVSFISVPGVGIEPTTPASSKARWTISSSRGSGAGRWREGIVGTHSLVSTPSKKPLPFLAWLGIARVRFPRIHPVFHHILLREAPKIQGCALPMSYPGKATPSYGSSLFLARRLEEETVRLRPEHVGQTNVAGADAPCFMISLVLSSGLERADGCVAGSLVSVPHELVRV